jgi:metal-responsive CopG/Arc/MetJ family transcriptional regulator
MSTTEKIQTSVVLSPAMYKSLRRAAAEQLTTQSAIITDALRQYLTHDHADDPDAKAAA